MQESLLSSSHWVSPRSFVGCCCSDTMLYTFFQITVVGIYKLGFAITFNRGKKPDSQIQSDRI